MVTSKLAPLPRLDLESQPTSKFMGESHVEVKEERRGLASLVVCWPFKSVPVLKSSPLSLQVFFLKFAPLSPLSNRERFALKNHKDSSCNKKWFSNNRNLVMLKI